MKDSADAKLYSFKLHKILRSFSPTLAKFLLNFRTNKYPNVRSVLMSTVNNHNNFHIKKHVKKQTGSESKKA